MAGPSLAESRPMLRKATLLLILLPGLALGQTTAGTVTALVTTQSVRGQANRADCASSTTLSTWTLVTSLTIAAGDKWRVATVATGTGCTTSGGVPTGIFQDVLATAATQAISSIPVNSMATGAGVTSCTLATDQDINLCVYYLPLGLTTNWQLAAQGTFRFQLAAPPAPVISGSTPGDSQLSLNVTPGTVTADYQATTGVTFTVTCTPPTGTAATGGPGNAGTIVCSGLTNGVAYKLTAVGSSVAGNPGATSAVYPAGTDTTPLPFADFWSTYKAVGGVETGGCGTGGAGALAPVLAVLALLAARRRRS